MNNFHVSRVFLLPIIIWAGHLATQTGCVNKDPLACNSSGQCDDPERPFCDQWGVYEESNGIGNTCIPTPEKSYCLEDGDYCVDGVHHKCTSEKFSEEIVCGYGCAEFEPRCLEAVPSGAGEVDFSGDLPEISFETKITINTDSGIVTSPDTSYELGYLFYPPSGGVPVRVIVVKSWMTGPVDVEGSAALAIYARDNILLNGVFDIGTAGQASETLCGDAWPAGRNGAGFGAVGGSGNDLDYVPRSTAGNGLLTPLRGGCGEGGGGALQLVSRTEIRVEDGYITAGGQGGKSYFEGNTQQLPTPARSAGSSGGAILLESPRIIFAPNTGLVANGGGGGCYPEGTPFSSIPRRGERGGFSTQPAESGCDRAGAGGALAHPAGGDTTFTGVAAGVGGGGVGRIRINVADGIWPHEDAPTDETNILSPAPVVGRIAVR